VNWLKQGKIFNVSGDFGWMNSHAQIPTVLVLEDRFRVFFSTRKEQGQSLTTFLDLDISNPSKILYVHDKPILDLGLPGTFDEHGIMPSDVLKVDDRVYLYYSGWSKRCSVPYSNLTGLAVSEDNGMTFNRMFDGPILSTNSNEPYSATSPGVIKYKQEYLMWYCSGTGWREIEGNYEHVYDIKKACSDDGINWLQQPKSVINVRSDLEAITRPVVFEKDNSFHMLYCYRESRDFRDGNGSYQIGYAYSDDLENWQRDDDNSGLRLPNSGWDSRMQAYPYVVKANDNIYLFYNGNGFGKTGFGYALLEK